MYNNCYSLARVWAACDSTHFPYILSAQTLRDI